MPQSSADSEDESAPSEGCEVPALFLRSSDRICKTSTKSWSVNWRARFFSLDLRRCAFFKSFATRCFSTFACCCSNFNRLICCDNDSPPTAGATGITAGILADPVVGGRLDAAPVSSVVSTAAGAATSPADAAAGISSDDIGWLEAEGSCDNLCFGFELQKTCVPTRESHPEPMQRYGTPCSRLRLRRKARNRRTQSNIKVHCEVRSGCGDAAEGSRTLHAMTNCFRFLDGLLSCFLPAHTQCNGNKNTRHIHNHGPQRMRHHTFYRKESHVALCSAETKAWRRMCSMAFSRGLTWQSVCSATDVIVQAAKQHALARCSFYETVIPRPAMWLYPDVVLASAHALALRTVSV